METKKEVQCYDSTNQLQKNENFFNYYINQKIINENEVDSFMEIINKELPITFRVLNNNKYCKFIHENIKKKLEHLCKDNYAITKLNEEDQMYEIYLTRSQIKKDENYKNLYNYLINLNESGYIFRQELVSMLPVLFLKLKEDFFVLDICAAPGSKTAQIVDYMHLIKKKSIKNYLIRKFIEKNSSLFCNPHEGIDEFRDSVCAEDSCEMEYSFGHEECSNRSSLNSSVKGSLNKRKQGNHESGERNELYRSLNNILDGNEYDNKLFEYILNTDNNLYEHYKKLISNNNPNGVVVANDANFKRCCMLFHRLKNIHSSCLVVTNNNAINFPYIYIKDEDGNSSEKRYFDSVLCDVPCSGDGTLRKDRNIWLNWNPFNAYNLFQMQVNILKRSIELTKEGGHIVYSTCSLNPIENEAVICEVFNSLDNRNCLKLINIQNEHINKLNYKEGLTKWKVLMDDHWFDTYEQYCNYLKTKESGKYKKIYDKIQNGMFAPQEKFIHDINLKYVKRFFPHHYNAGGFFIAVIKKCGKLQWKEEKKIKNKKYTNSNKCSMSHKVTDSLKKEEKDKYRKKYKYRRNRKKKKKEEKDENGDFIHLNEIKPDVNEKEQKVYVSDGLVHISDYFPEPLMQNREVQNYSRDSNSNIISNNRDLIAQNCEEDNYNVIDIDDVMTSYNVVTSNEVMNKYNLIDNDDLTSNYNMIDSDDMVRNSNPVVKSNEVQGADIISVINKRSEEELKRYLGNDDSRALECKLEEVNKDGVVEDEAEVERKTQSNVDDKTDEERVEERKREKHKMIKQQEYISLDYYEKLLPTNDILKRIKNYFNLNDDFLFIKNNLYIHLKDDCNFTKLSINERINVNIKKINLVSKYTKDILECYTKIKLKIISAGITVIQIDKNKNNAMENYYRINYSGCLNFLPFFKDVDEFLLNRTYRDETIKNYFSPVYENENRVFNFESYMEQLIGERKSTLSKGISSKERKEVKEVLAKLEIQNESEKKEETEEENNVGTISNNQISSESEHNVKNKIYVDNHHEGETHPESHTCEGNTEPNGNIYKTVSNDQENGNNVNTIWVKSDAILDLIKIDKSRINNITNDTIRQTAKLMKYSPNILLTLNRNKQILAIPSSKGNLYVDISIDKNSIIMLPYVLN
ncbi:hypothetical protein, conserved [Plasmodium gonderi]|uniref:SAM-dependent MTase RsmB/NOP-type domain-containing protein n=1 Tax=Plasmodium gonderi TaxID=77519 RepID=A0A1Y1J8P6_PLAGO|nr:hypothetical protein, conserved [Plasmodium gonderi]GAW78881.1 hypothetical protein, conserved [Plasmodium gonderi]